MLSKTVTITESGKGLMVAENSGWLLVWHHCCFNAETTIGPVKVLAQVENESY